MGKVYEKVTVDYRNDDVELNSLFFDFKMPDTSVGEMLRDYRDLAKDINGDLVVIMEEIPERMELDGKIKHAKLLDFEEIAVHLDDMYESSLTVLEVLTCISSECHLYRIIDAKYKEDDGTVLVGGILVDDFE